MELPVPSPAQIALALAVVRSKPQNSSFEDYISQLLKQNKSAPGFVQISKLGDTDEAAYWKNAFQKCEHEKDLLLEQLYDIQHEQHEQQSKKRKADSQSPVNANMRSKRQNGEPGKDLNDAPGSNWQNVHKLAETNGPEVKQFLKSFFLLNITLKSDRHNTFDLCQAIAKICHCFKTITLASDQLSTVSRKQSSATIPQLSERFCIACPIILQALTKCKSGRDTNNFNVACVYVVDMLQHIFHCVHNLSVKEVMRRRENDIRKSSKAESNTKIAKRYDQSDQSICDESCKELAKVVVCLITSVDVTDQSQCELLEVMICALLERIGTALAITIFSDPTESDLNGVALADLPYNFGPSHPEIITTAIRLEAPYLIYMLQQSLKFLRQNQRRMTGSAVKLFTVTSGDASTKQSITQRIETVLQNTLMRGLFGDADHTFENSLLREQPLEEEHLRLITNESQDKCDGPEWFLAQVWEQLGWDVLGRATSTATT